MRLRSFFLLAALGGAVAFFLNQDAKQAYNDCVAAGVQSNETCAYYSGYAP